jgi:hypothetical protein
MRGAVVFTLPARIAIPIELRDLVCPAANPPPIVPPP